MPKFKCVVTDCVVEFPDVDKEIQKMMMTTHNLEAHGALHTPLERGGGGGGGDVGAGGQHGHGQPKTQKIARPMIPDECSESEWAFFQSKWVDYKRFYQLQLREDIYTHLRSCCTDALQYKLYTATGGSDKDMAEEAMMKEIKRLAVQKVNIAVHVKEFLQMVQDGDETVRKYHARLRGKALSCEFSVSATVRCTCGVDTNTQVSYMDEMLRHKVITGLADQDILQDVLAADKKTLPDTIAFIEGKEGGKQSQQSLAGRATVSKISQEVEDTVRCGFCGRTGHGAQPSESTRKAKCPAWSAKCHKCGKVGHFISRCKGKPKQASTAQVKVIKEEAEVSIIQSTFCSYGVCQVRGTVDRKSVQVPHWLHDQVKGWRKSSPMNHPWVNINVKLCSDGYEAAGIAMPVEDRQKQTPHRGLTDTGAQTTCAGMGLVRALGLMESDLVPVSMGLNTAVNSKMIILGALFVEIYQQDEYGATWKSKQLCYIARGLNTVYLSQSACIDLAIVPTHFPKVGGCAGSRIGGVNTTDKRTKEVVGKMMTGGSEDMSHKFEEGPCQPDETGKCSCPRRQLPPEPPVLPCPATPDNRGMLEQVIRTTYAASAFNQCETQQLPHMTGPPLQIFLKQGAKPVAIHKAIPVPANWQLEVKAGLDRDCALGVIEKVGPNTPCEWCCRMVCIPKKTGRPRRTVDLQPLNRATLRQTHQTASPFHLARSVPEGTVKSVLDMWNSYHSVPIREEDRKLTTFITPWGRYRYRCVPQGGHWSGDAFTHRHDDITKDFPDIAKCIDDAILWSKNLAEEFAHVCRYLTLCAANGIVFNPEKFVFGQKEVDFAGFTITEDSVKPCKAYLDGILNFPAPTDISGARSFFGLVNQASYAFSMQSVMQPFRDLLKPGVKFLWTEEMQTLFDKAKQHIVELIQEGVRIFDMTRKTCLATDWSRQGIGFFLLQQHCQCLPNSQGQVSPTCCNGGWKLIFAGGRFTTPAESRYSPIEGEALAVVTALYKARYFVLGLEDLTVAVDHKPLLKVFGDRKLEEMDNPRLTNLKEKALYFRFNMVHVPGRLHKGADAMSRVSSTSTPGEVQAAEIGMIMAGSSTKDIRMGFLRQMWSERPVRVMGDIVTGLAKAKLSAEMSDLGRNEMAEISGVGEGEEVIAVTWDRVAAATQADPNLSAIKQTVECGSHENLLDMEKQVPEFKGIMDRLSTVEGVLVYKGRAIIPESLRQSVLDGLHGAHQGCSGMTRRAERCVYWPGITEDIKLVRARCGSCDTVAPSQPAAPPTPLPEPEYPFQLIAADYFQLEGHEYLVVVDRYSGWLSVYDCGGRAATSSKLTEALRTHFSTFGISEELASDEGSQFTSGITKRFLAAWGVRQRLSSAYHPHSNCRAEMGVKTAKRLLRQNTGQDGSITNGKFHRALLAHRNTPDPDTEASPAQVLFGRPIRDLIPILPGKFQPQLGWRLAREERERALRVRYCKGKEAWSEHTKSLPVLVVGEKVLVQNQAGTPKIAKRWDRSGVILEVRKFDQYLIKIDGSGRISLRNRRFLRRVTPYQSRKPAPSSTDSSSVPPEQQHREEHVHDESCDQGTARAGMCERGEEVDREMETMGGTETMFNENILAEGGKEKQGEVVESSPAPSPTIQTGRPQRIRRPNVKYREEVYDLSRD